MSARFCMINRSCQVDESLFGRNLMRRRWLRIYFCSKSSWVPALYLMLHGVYVWINLSFRVFSHEKTAMRRKSGHGFHACQVRVETRELPDQFCCTGAATPTSSMLYFRILLGNKPRCWRTAIILTESGVIELPLLTTSLCSLLPSEVGPSILHGFSFTKILQSVVKFHHWRDLICMTWFDLWLGSHLQITHFWA